MLYTIEVGSKDDIRQIMNISREVYRNSNPELTKEQTFLEILENKKHLILLAKESKFTIAYTITIERNKNFYIWAFGVSVDQIKKGLGSNLLEKNAKIAKENNFPAITITAYNNQPELIELLKEKGYVEYRKNQTEGSIDFKLEF